MKWQPGLTRPRPRPLNPNDDAAPAERPNGCRSVASGQQRSGKGSGGPGKSIRAGCVAGELRNLTDRPGETLCLQKQNPGHRMFRNWRRSYFKAASMAMTGTGLNLLKPWLPKPQYVIKAPINRGKYGISKQS